MSGNLRAEILCGGNIPGGTMTVGDNAWKSFCAAWVSFPGFSVFEASGHWEGSTEKTRVIVLYGPNNQAFMSEVRKIAEAYRREFGQDSVAWGFSPATFYLTDKAN